MSNSINHRGLLWLYVTNATLLICHEIDSAYWREWELFRLHGGADLFVLLHVPLFGFVLWGLVLIAQGDSKFTSAVAISLIVAFSIASVAQVSLACYLYESTSHML